LAVGRRELTQNGRWMAAVLACGADALLSDSSAAALWGLLPSPSRSPIEVMTPRRGVRPRGIRVRYTGHIHPEDVSQLHNIPVTSVARTILDLAPLLPADRLLKAIEAAARQRLFSLPALDRAIARSPRRPGARKLREVLAAYREPPDTWSGLEEQFWELIREAGVPLPEVNVLVAGLVVDFFWPKTRLVVELDSRAYHQSPRAFENDRRRDARLLRHDCRVLRVTHQRMKSDRAGLLDDVQALATPPPA
jgi:very-short-patch-repair endonuclease